MKLQGSEVQDHETLQSQIGKIAENRLPLSGLEIFHGRLFNGRIVRERAQTGAIELDAGLPLPRCERHLALRRQHHLQGLPQTHRCCGR
jgi:hypothetical protein